VIQYIVTGGSNQRWNFIATGDGYQVVNAKTGYCLTTNGVTGSQLYVTYCNSANPRQVWDLPPQLTKDSASHGGALATLVTPGSSGLGGFTPPTYRLAEVQSNSWQPGAAIVTGSGAVFLPTVAQRLVYWYWG
jgi:hypothetical protein